MASDPSAAGAAASSRGREPHPVARLIDLILKFSYLAALDRLRRDGRAALSPFGLQLHRPETFWLSTDPLFIETLRVRVGL